MSEDERNALIERCARLAEETVTLPRQGEGYEEITVRQRQDIADRIRELREETREL